MKLSVIADKLKSYVLNKAYVPRELYEELEGPALLHISDTPSGIYEYIKKVIEEINPKYIVHTGDIVDDVKLGAHPDHVDNYRRNCKVLISILECYSKAELFYVMGNHDDKGVVKELVKKGHVLEKGIINIEKRSIYLNHYYLEDAIKSDYYLFGHSFEPMHCENKGNIALNGVLNINVIDLKTGRVFHLDYPGDTNIQRKMVRRKIGL